MEITCNKLIVEITTEKLGKYFYRLKCKWANEMKMAQKGEEKIKTNVLGIDGLNVL
jgi:hypothetical protein